ncbi:TRAP transporter large permease [Phyllobacterium sp. 21LDTY02-6]|uniref:TRAP transporter large permease n=1 Tax=unclassified Phyllobacterium TaxID=2638441 RepID=UPI0020219D59|nr:MULTISPECIES: TRAP transporter large permease [unclassified Phyllobacterium]MCO4319526.1 TRAP transporter large permease [Phyllobacterium sp. 21LDTY02-6]MCX8279712.1 TRAP transporter large permease [Phyllobacterium sp. 0TCS1.6C]MCX8295684.1 TRAP transporter large permease [Phyllobacterium sp. 0TCS1.6A]
MLGLAAVTLFILCALVLIGLPIVISLAASVLFFLAISGGWELALPQQTLGGVGDYILITLPLFILAGGIMNATGIADKLFDFGVALVGWLRGGLAHVDVVASVMFGGMIGTSVADLAGSGSVTIPKLKAHGYPGPFAAAVTATSSGIGVLIPPSSPMILYSAVTGTSLGALFLAGVIPGLLMALAMMITISILARRNGWKPVGTFQWKEVLRTGKHAILPLGMPGLILFGLMFGIFTATEAGAFAVAYAVVLAAVVYRTLTFSNLRRALVDSCILTGEVLMVVGFSTALGWALSQAGVPAALAHGLETVFPFENTTLKIFALLAIALIAGMVLDPLIPMIMPVLLPSLMAMDVDLIHFGVLMVTTVVIGQVTPPVAIALLVAAKIGNEDVMRVTKANMPFLVALFLFLILLTLFPVLSTALPALLK